VTGTHLSWRTQIMLTLTACQRLQERASLLRYTLIVTLYAHWLSCCFTRPVLSTNPSFSLETDVRRCSIRPNPATGGSSKPPGSNENRAVRVCGTTFQSLCGLLCNSVDRVVSLGATIGFELRPPCCLERAFVSHPLSEIENMSQGLERCLIVMFVRPSFRLLSTLPLLSAFRFHPTFLRYDKSASYNCHPLSDLLLPVSVTAARLSRNLLKKFLPLEAIRTVTS
jgi:hypothetical protein